MWNVTISGLRAHYGRVLRTCVAVLLGVAFLAGTLVLGDTMRAGFSSMFDEALSGTDISIDPADPQAPESANQQMLLPESTLESVAAIDGVDRGVGWIQGIAQLVDSSGEAVGGGGPPTFASNWVDDPDLNPMHIAQGRAPAASGEVVIDAASAATMGIEAGDSAVVRTPEPVEVTVVGVARMASSDSIGGASMVGFTLDDARRLLLGGAPGYSSIALAASPGTDVDALLDRVDAELPEGFQARDAATVAADNQQAINEDFLDVFRYVLLGFTAVALLVAGFSIYNTFSVVLAQRSRESALLRAIGATRSQVLGSIAVEALLVGAIASVGGLLAGIGLAVGLNSLLGSIGMDLPGSIEVAPSSVIASVVVGMVVTMIASLLPALRASAVPPLAALRGAATDSSASSRVRAVLGVVLAGGGVAAVMWGALGLPDGALGIVGAGALATLIGFVVLGPVVARPAAAALGAPLAAGRNVPGELARSNAMRSPRRTAGTAAALMVGVAVVALFTVAASSVSLSVREAVVGTIDADRLIVDESSIGMPTSLATDIDALDGVESTVGLGFGTAEFDGTTIGVTMSDPAALESMLDPGVVEGSLAGLGPDEIAISSAVSDEHGWRIGSEVVPTFGGGSSLPLRVGAIYDDAQLAGETVMHRSTWEANNIGSTDTVVAIRIDPSADDAAVVASIDEATRAAAAPASQTPEEYADDMAGQLNVLLGIVYVLLALSILIALMGISNTLSLSINERTRELGLLRAIGQTRSQVRSMVRREAVVIAAFGTVGGLMLGCFLAWGLISGLGALDPAMSRFSAPIVQLSTIAAIGAGAGVIAALRPASRAARIPVLDAITSD